MSTIVHATVEGETHVLNIPKWTSEGGDEQWGELWSRCGTDASDEDVLACLRAFADDAVMDMLSTRYMPKESVLQWSVDFEKENEKKGRPTYSPNTKNKNSVIALEDDDRADRDGRWLRIFILILKHVKASGGTMYQLYVPALGLSEMQKAEAVLAELIGVSIKRVEFPASEYPEVVKKDPVPLQVKLLSEGNETQRTDAIIVLAKLAYRTMGHQTSIATAGGIPPLVEFVRTGTPQQKKWAAYALANLAWGENRTSIAAAGGIPPLVELVRTGTASQKTQATCALGNLAWGENRTSIAAAGGIPLLVELVRTGTAEQKDRATEALANLALDYQNQTSIAAAGGIPLLVELVRTGTAEQKNNAAYALRNLAWDNRENQTSIAAAGGIPPLVELVRTGTAEQKTDAASALANFACDNPENQTSIAAAGGIPPLVELVRTGMAEQKQWAACALRDLAWDNPENQTSIAAAGGIPPLVELVRTGTAKQKKYAVRTLQWLAWDNAYIEQQVVAAGFEDFGYEES